MRVALVMNHLRLQFARVRQGWLRFWFHADHGRQIVLYRRLFSGLLFCVYASRSADVAFFYSDGGILPATLHHELLQRPYTYSLLDLAHSPLAACALHAAMLLSLALLFMGRWVRPAAVAAWLLHLTFLHRNLTIAYGVDFISVFFLFYLALMSPRPAMNKRRRLSELGTMLSSVAFRMTQIQLCTIYGFSGLRKLAGVRWWQGEAIWDVMANDQITRTDLTWVSHLPVFIVGMTYATLAWEIYFPALIWFRKWRYPMLAFGVLLHLGIGATVNISFFCALMILSYSLFLDPAHASAFHAWLAGFPRNLMAARKVRHAATDESFV